jgi:hypothetical protein
MGFLCRLSILKSGPVVSGPLPQLWCGCFSQRSPRPPPHLRKGGVLPTGVGTGLGTRCSPFCPSTCHQLSAMARVCETSRCLLLRDYYARLDAPLSYGYRSSSLRALGKQRKEHLMLRYRVCVSTGSARPFLLTNSIYLLAECVCARVCVSEA